MVVSRYSKTHLSQIFQQPPETVLDSLCQNEKLEILLSLVFNVRVDESANGHYTQTVVTDMIRS